MSAHSHTVSFNLADKGVAGTKLTPLYSTPAASGAILLHHVELAPFAALVAAVE